MKCPVCGAKTSGLLWFDGSRAFFQCLKHSNHLFFPVEAFTLSKELLYKAVFERAERISEDSVIFVDPKKAKIIAAMGSRVASFDIMNIVGNLTEKDMKALRKYAATIKIISEEIENRIKGNFPKGE